MADPNSGPRSYATTSQPERLNPNPSPPPERSSLFPGPTLGEYARSYAQDSGLSHFPPSRYGALPFGYTQETPQYPQHAPFGNHIPVHPLGLEPYYSMSNETYSGRSHPSTGRGFSTDQQVSASQNRDDIGQQHSAELPRVMEPNIHWNTHQPYGRHMAPGPPPFAWNPYEPPTPAMPLIHQAPQPDIPSNEALGSANSGRTSSRPSGASIPIPHRRTVLQRRTSHGRRPYLPGARLEEPSSQAVTDSSSHSASDRSVSPRTSNRRSFDRYATDLHSSETAAAEDVARIRAQRPRLREGLQRSHLQHQDPNVPTDSQMQMLKDKLVRLLPSQLADDASTCCDICQKDYSQKQCIPSEAEEMAVLLPCHHAFGEWCINEWFSTCRKHKNKITCPMCRVLLVEPLPSRGYYSPLSHVSGFMAALARTREGRGDRGGVSDLQELEEYLLSARHRFEMVPGNPSSREGHQQRGSRARHMTFSELGGGSEARSVDEEMYERLLGAGRQRL